MEFARKVQKKKLYNQNLLALHGFMFLGIILCFHKVLFSSFAPDFYALISTKTQEIMFNILDVYPITLHRILKEISEVVMGFGMLLIGMSIYFLIVMWTQSTLNDPFLPSRDIFGTKEEVKRDLKYLMSLLMCASYDDMKDLMEKPLEYKDSFEKTLQTDYERRERKFGILKDRYVCPHCNQTYIAKSDFKGFIPNCKNCGAVLEHKN